MKYALTEEFQPLVGTDGFLSTHVGPAVYRLLGPVLGKTLSIALLWAATTADNMHGNYKLMPTWLKQRIVQKVQSVSPAGHGPVVRRAPLVVSGHAGLLHITEIESECTTSLESGVEGRAQMTAVQSGNAFMVLVSHVP